MSETKKYCTSCILDSEIPNITFDEDGICNYCDLLNGLQKKYPLNEGGQKYLNNMVNKIKRSGKGSNYDCIVGVSGGVDSTYVLYLAKKLGLRPLAVHCDNGWNSELAVSNIKNMLDILDVDLFTYVINWREFKELQKAFFKASVPDIETLTDNANTRVLYNIASKYRIKYIIKGNNFRTEGIVPRGWTYFDGKYFNHLRKTFSDMKVKTYPKMSLFHHVYFPKFKRIKIFKILNYVEYDKKKVLKLLEEELNWRNYGGKHYESIFTRFFQSYYLPQKFDIDKRKIHLSALICSGQLSREEALAEISKTPYPPELIKKDIEYIYKKLEFSQEEFDEILKSTPLTFRDYPSQFKLIQKMKKIMRLLNPTSEHRP
jgi:N-acetyl sugar amidotransferase